MPHSPAWVVQTVSKDLGRLVGAVEVRVVPRDGIRGRAAVRVHVHPQDGPGEVAAFIQASKTRSAHGRCVDMTCFAFSDLRAHLSPSISSISSRVIMPSPRMMCSRPSGLKRSWPPRCFLCSSATSINTRTVRVSTWLGFFLWKNLPSKDVYIFTRQASYALYEIGCIRDCDNL